MCEPCGGELKCNNDQICQYIDELKRQRDELVHLIRKQEEEKSILELEIERMTYKINVISRSLAQRTVARDRYNETIAEAEDFYGRLVESSEVLLDAVAKDFNELFESMDKKVGTDLAEEKKCATGLCALKTCRPSKQIEMQNINRDTTNCYDNTCSNKGEPNK